MTVLRNGLLVPQRYSNRFSSNPFPLNDLQFYADLWNIEQQGFLLSYDGNDYLSNATADFRLADSQGAIEIWCKFPSPSGFYTLVSSSDTGTATSYFQIYLDNATGRIVIAKNDAGGGGQSAIGTANVADGKYHHVVISSSGTAYSIFFDGVVDAISAGTNDGDWFGDVTLRDNITVAAKVANTTVNYAVGEIGFIRIYSRPMLQPESQLNYQRGRKASASDTTGLVFNLPCTEGTGNPVDTVGSLTMTLTGATWVEGLMDRSTNALALTSFGSPTWGIQGRTFNETNYILATATALNFTTSNFSIVAWVKLDDFTTNHTIVCRGLANAEGWRFEISATQRLDFYTSQAATEQRTFGTNDFPSGTWAMATAVRNEAAVTLYQNVTDKTSSAATHINPTTSSRTAKLGIYDDITNGGLDGTYGEVRIYSRILSIQEIQQIYNSTRWRYGV